MSDAAGKKLNTEATDSNCRVWEIKARVVKADFTGFPTTCEDPPTDPAAGWQVWTVSAAA